MDEADVIGATAYPYTGEVLVEVTGRDAEGYLVVTSYQFEYADGELRAKQPIEPPHVDAVRRALAEKDYALASEPPVGSVGEE